MHTLNVLSIFLCGTSLGGLVLLPLVPLKEIGPRFYRFFGILGGVFIAIYGFFNLAGLSWLWAATLGSLAFYCLAMTFFPTPLGSKVFFPLSILLLSALFIQLVAAHQIPVAGTVVEKILYFGNFLSCALYLGATLMSMILGHWYLVEPKLSIEPFMKLTWAFILTLISRTVFISGGFLYDSLTLTGGKRYALEQFLSVEGELIFLIQRILFGILLPALLSYFIYNTVKIRSTQSATGILYVNLVFVLIGELIGINLSLRTGFIV